MVKISAALKLRAHRVDEVVEVGGVFYSPEQIERHLQFGFDPQNRTARPRRLHHDGHVLAPRKERHPGARVDAPNHRIGACDFESRPRRGLEHGVEHSVGWKWKLLLGVGVDESHNLLMLYCLDEYFDLNYHRKANGQSPGGLPSRLV